MKPSYSTYHASNANIGIDAEINRLKAQALMGWEKEYRYLKWHGLEDGKKVLEVGYGPGFVTEQLADNLPNSEITALDVDEKLLESAKQQNKHNKKVEFINASVYDTGLPDNSYDFVIARLIFLHLHEPIKAAAEIFRVLKPGGKLVIIDIDDGIFGAIQPGMENLRTVIDKLIQMQKKAGGNREIGRSLPRLFQSAGFTDIDLEAVSVHSDLVGKEGFNEQFNPKRFEHFYKNGTLSEADFQTVKNAYDQLHNPDSYAMMIFLLACGTKPHRF
ncbi:methyltransferase domain-containing protein [Gracilibacillus oryzae]|uniref:Methyltransferase domain-containing protein n=1 Tax=Gracilibacillus oryzae TaxID=1672701 RepID=A0A7C8KQ26_9BACI|nr:methyltransferase domain-containing protein [Gracilibacillus oryzae]KAB8135714.1 methyltransferase domain-containing protein [Gracilibacillus oryzae]